jgi:hypothetical protein
MQVAGFGAIPKPTVQSGWEKMKVLANVQKREAERLFGYAFYLLMIGIRSFFGFLRLNFLPFVR